MDSIRDLLSRNAASGVNAFSTAPSDRYFGITEEEYNRIASDLVRDTPRNNDLSRPLTVATLVEWYRQPLFKNILDHLESRFPKLTLQLVDRDRFADIYEPSKFDMFLSPIGMTPGDPISHFMFMANFIEHFRKVVTVQSIAEAAQIEDKLEFGKTIHQFELDILKERVLVPLFHFPGVSAISPIFEKSSKFGSAWGIQSWHYSIR